jgi:TetR/AcrR family transcriptional regulator, transcriptional repressor for nem operon
MSKAERTKQFIVEKTAPIFNMKGYNATSMNDILKVTGLTKGGVYCNFENKDEIAGEAFEYSFGKIKDALKIKVQKQNTAKGKLTAILSFYKNYSIKPITEGGCPIQNTAIDSDDNIPFLKKKAQKSRLNPKVWTNL